jgi:predicted ATPase/DNA-binding CsgD family transcriptional regulator
VTALTWGQRRDNLPAEVTRFIGRRRELPAIADAIERYRLVTLRGTSGVGKTRLALRVAADLRDAFADGCWLVQLSPLRTPELLARAVSEALGLPDEAAGDDLAVLAASLAERELLLVLDTCEHLNGAVAELAAHLLQAAPGLRILATSRAPLGAPGEEVLLISPLELPAAPPAGLPAAPASLPAPAGSPAAVPPADLPATALASATAPAPAAGLAEVDAVALFVDRARAAVPGFALTGNNTASVAELCRRLEGIPLALELAAVRLRGMPVAEILARLSDRFRVLGSTRTAVDRHRTLHAAVSWSYDLCTPAERRLWAELSVFPGGFGLDAAAAVCGPGAGDTVRRLVEKSVMQYTPGPEPAREPGGAPALSGIPDPDGGRYHLLDTMREFGAEQLAAADGAGVRARHRDYYLELAGRAAAGTMSAEQAGWLRRLAQETANLRVALDFSFTAPGEEAAGLRMTQLLLSYWLMTGQFTEGRRWHDRAATVSPGTPEQARAVFGAGVLAVQQGDFATGGPLLERATALAAAVGDADLAAHVTDARGILAFYSGDLPAAQAEFEAALAVYERDGFTDPAALVSYGRLASVCLLTFELDRAARLCEECVRRCDEIGEQWARGTALWVRGAARWLSGDNVAAIEDSRACLRIKDALGDLHTTAMSFDLLSVCLVATGDFERSAVLYGAGDALWGLLNAPVLMGPAYAEIRNSGAETARAQLGEERFDALAGHGFALPLPAALAVALGDAGPAPAARPGTGTGGTVPAKPLTRRERQVAELVADGLGNRDIADRLVLSKRTVDSHIEHIFGKLGFTSRTQLANWVFERRERRLTHPACG